ncbi:MAG: flagellar protein FlgN [Pseudomonadota bacterium]
MVEIKGAELEIIYHQITDLWKRFCEEHNNLFDLTLDEYSALLSSDIDKVDAIITEKNKVIANIGQLEELRQELINQINVQMPAERQIKKISELIIVMREFEEKNGQSHLFRFNQLLIDIIEKIQLQNKKNQIFINKAIVSLREIRENALGKKFSTYTPRGQTTTKTKEHFSPVKS